MALTFVHGGGGTFNQQESMIFGQFANPGVHLSTPFTWSLLDNTHIRMANFSPSYNSVISKDMDVNYGMFK